VTTKNAIVTTNKRRGRSPKPKPEQQKFVVGTQEIMIIVGLSKQRITQLVAEGMPKQGVNQFYLPDSIQWLIGSKVERQQENLDITQQRTQLFKAQTEKHEIDNRIRKGELIEIEDFQRIVFDLANLVSQQIDAVEPRISKALPLEARKDFRIELKSIRESIANAVENFANTIDSIEDSEAATGT